MKIIATLKSYLENQNIGVQTTPVVEIQKRQHVKLSNTTINGYCSNLRQFFNWMNVCMHFRRNNKFKIEKPRIAWSQCYLCCYRASWCNKPIQNIIGI